LDDFCNAAKIKSVHQFIIVYDDLKYSIDYYLPKYKIAIEIDDFDHKNRDQKYEHKREQFIKKQLGCIFIRCDPDDNKFIISGLIGKIHYEILSHS